MRLLLGILLARAYPYSRPMTTEKQAAPPANPIIRGEKVYLRPPERGDIDDFVRWFNDADTLRYLSMRGPMGHAAEERWFDGMLERYGKRDYLFVICLLDSGRAIGTVGLHEVDEEAGSAAFGIAIGEKAEWDKGYGTDALNAISDFGFGELRLERIWLDVYEQNLRGQRSYEKAGFTREGIMRGAIFKHGEFADVHRMSLLRDEWLALPRRQGATTGG
jgi:RimJ/RimL family protein N-acetyltransferase